MTDDMPMTATDPRRPVDVTPVHDFTVGDEVHYTGTAGEHRGVIAEVRTLADGTGAQLKAFVLHIPGVGALLTSGDALRPTKRTQAASIEIPRSAYADTSVPQVTDTRNVRPADPADSYATGGVVGQPDAGPDGRA